MAITWKMNLSSQPAMDRMPLYRNKSSLQKSISVPIQRFTCVKCSNMVSESFCGNEEPLSCFLPGPDTKQTSPQLHWPPHNGKYAERLSEQICCRCKSSTDQINGRLPLDTLQSIGARLHPPYTFKITGMLGQPCLNTVLRLQQACWI